MIARLQKAQAAQDDHGLIARFQKRGTITTATKDGGRVTTLRQVRLSHLAKVPAQIYESKLYTTPNGAQRATKTISVRGRVLDSQATTITSE